MRHYACVANTPLPLTWVRTFIKSSMMMVFPIGFARTSKSYMFDLSIDAFASQTLDSYGTIRATAEVAVGTNFSIMTQFPASLLLFLVFCFLSLYLFLFPDGLWHSLELWEFSIIPMSFVKVETYQIVHKHHNCHLIHQ